MLTPQDVRSVQFEKNLRGYRTEDVDRFLDKVEEQLQQNDAQAEQSVTVQIPWAEVGSAEDVSLIQTQADGIVIPAGI